MPDIPAIIRCKVNLFPTVTYRPILFSPLSAISWRPVLVVEEAGVPGENHRPWASNWSTLSLAAASRVHFFCNLQSRASCLPMDGGSPRVLRLLPLLKLVAMI
jgi:hypothetical protein